MCVVRGALSGGDAVSRPHAVIGHRAVSCIAAGCVTRESGRSTSGMSRERLEPRVDRGEVAIGDDLWRKQARAVDAAEVAQVDAPREPRSAQALRSITVAERAAQSTRGERVLAGG